MIAFPPCRGLTGIQAVECESCGLVRLSPRRSAACTELNYRSAVSVDHFEKHRFPQTVLANLWLDKIEKYRKPGKMLDVGCGSGILLDAACNRGWQTYGLEITESCVNFVRQRGHQIVCDNIETSDSFEADYFDAACLLFVLEHLHDPLGALRHIAKWLKPGGICFIQVPNLSSLRHKIAALLHREALSHVWDIPAHNFFFTPKTLDRLVHAAELRGQATASIHGAFLLRHIPSASLFKAVHAVFHALFGWFDGGGVITGIYEKPLVRPPDIPTGPADFGQRTPESQVGQK